MTMSHCQDQRKRGDGRLPSRRRNTPTPTCPYDHAPAPREEGGDGDGGEGGDVVVVADGRRVCQKVRQGV